MSKLFNLKIFMLFVPKQSKYKKSQKGKRINLVNSNLSLKELQFGKIGLRTTKPANLSSKQIESLRQTINKIIKKKGKFKIKIFPQVQITKKPIEVRMGKGKGNVYKWVAKVKAGTILCEIETLTPNIALKAMKLTQFKLPISTKIFNY